MKKPFTVTWLGIAAVVAVVGFAAVASASHSWGSYHWARTANPFTLKLGDNASSVWDAHLGIASTDWNLSSVLDTTVVAGSTKPKTCRATNGRVEVCNATYGRKGWLGIAQIWVSGSHITQGIVKLNDTYFNRAPYNTAPWRQLVMCQEIGHTFGLDHQDENFDNPNLGTCMDYTSDPDGPLSNEHPNAHDYEQLETIYTHTDDTTTILSAAPSNRNGRNLDLNLDVLRTADPDELRAFGEELRRDARNRASLYVRDLGLGRKVFTFVTWAE
ncbi:MAG: hypothetical protein AAB891_01960 [Patescibacteria group bacterium]